MRHFKNGCVWTGVCLVILLVAASRAAGIPPGKNSEWLARKTMRNAAFCYP